MKLFGKKAVFTYGGDDNKNRKEKPNPEAIVHLRNHKLIDSDNVGSEEYPEKNKGKPKRIKKTREAKRKKEKALTYAPRISVRGIFGIIGIITSLFLLFVLSPLVTRIANEEMGTAIRAVSNIPKGSPLDTVNLEIVEMPVKSIPNNAIRAIGEIAGLFASTDISEGDYLLTNKLSETLPFKDEYLYTIPDDLFAMSLRIKSFENGLAGKLLSGDIVCVYASMPAGDADDSYLAAAPPELRYVRVLSITTGTGSDYDRNGLEENLDNMESELPVTVELLVSERQARALAGLNQNAVIHLALASRGSPDHEEYLLMLQREFLERQAAEEAAIEEEKAAQETSDDAEAAENE